MAQKKKAPRKGERERGKHAYKGSTSRQRERLKGGVLLLLIPLAILLAALVRGGVEANEGDVADWQPAATGAAQH